jgi:hypothetical protein
MVVGSTKATYMIDFWMSPQKIINSAYHKIPLSKKYGFFFREIFENKLSGKNVYNLELGLS